MSKKKTGIKAEDLQLHEEKEMYACKVWGLQKKLGKIKSNGTREK